MASPSVRNRVSPVTGFLSWWDGVELWLSGLGFVLQTLVVMPVVLALAYLTGDMSLVGEDLRPVSAGPAVTVAM